VAHTKLNLITTLKLTYVIPVDCSEYTIKMTPTIKSHKSVKYASTPRLFGMRISEEKALADTLIVRVVMQKDTSPEEPI